MQLAVWAPAPPSPSGIADYAAEQLPWLARDHQVVSVSDPGAGGEVPVEMADLHLYHLGNSPAHRFVYRAALARPGVVILHDWSLHHLVLCETVERGDAATYLREMRRAHGPRGTFVGRQVARVLGGDLLPALFPLNDRVLEGCLAVVGLTRHVCSRAQMRLPGRPILHLPHHLSIPLAPLPSRHEARLALGLPLDALVVTAPGLATGTKRLDVVTRVVARLQHRFPSIRLVVAGEVDPLLPLDAWARETGLGDRLVCTGRLSIEDFVRHLAAADVVSSLRFPCYGEISGAMVRALGVGRPVLVTAGTPAAEEFPAGVVVPVDPGPTEEAELEALLSWLLGDESLRQIMGRLAREHVERRHSLAGTTAQLSSFLSGVLCQAPDLRRRLMEDRPEEDTLLGYLAEEVRWGAREVGLHGVHLGLKGLLADLVGSGR